MEVRLHRLQAAERNQADMTSPIRGRPPPFRRRHDSSLRAICSIPPSRSSMAFSAPRACASTRCGTGYRRTPSAARPGSPGLRFCNRVQNRNIRCQLALYELPDRPVPARRSSRDPRDKATTSYFEQRNGLEKAARVLKTLSEKACTSAEPYPVYNRGICIGMVFQQSVGSVSRVSEPQLKERNDELVAARNLFFVDYAVKL